MAAPTFQVDEFNGSGATVTTAVPQTAFANVDSASTSLLSAANSIPDATNSYEKWQKLHVTGVAPTAILTTSVYYGAAVEDNAASTATVQLFFGVNQTFATPTTATSSKATVNANTVTSAPGTSITAPANTVGALSGYITEQIQTNSSAAGGPCIFASPYRTFQFTWN
jgi:hypothetical protein